MSHASKSSFLKKRTKKLHPLAISPVILNDVNDTFAALSQFSLNL